MDEFASAGNCVLVLWGSSSDPELLKAAATSLSARVGTAGKVQLENVERLLLSSHASSTFDVALSGFVDPASTIHSAEILAELVRILKPGGKLAIREAFADGEHFKTPSQMVSAMKLAGYVQVSEPSSVQLSDDHKISLKSVLKVPGNITVHELSGCKPQYEVGASSQLKISFAKKPEPPKVDENVVKVWSLSTNDMMDDDIELIDDDDLLDADDLVKPDPESLRVKCGDGTQRKKACKNCSCGLAEELAAEGQPKTKATNATSACGSCFLGDAFRCASCPYLGMPAFKPGEKIALTDRQLKGDL